MAHESQLNEEMNENMFQCNSRVHRTPPPPQQQTITTKRVTRSTKTSCNLCKEPDNNEMVMCDKCELWCHFACVGVTGEIEKHPWSCENCSPSIVRNQAGACWSNEPLGTSNLNESENTISIQNITSNRVASNPARSKNGSTISSRLKRRALEMEKLKEERKLKEMRDQEELRMREKRDKEYLEKKYQLRQAEIDDEELSDCSDEEGQMTVQERVNPWLNNTNLITQTDATTNKVVLPNTLGEHRVPTNQAHVSEPLWHGTIHQHPQNAPSRHQPPHRQNLLTADHHPQNTPLSQQAYGLGALNLGRNDVNYDQFPSKQQLSARHSIPKDLPIFNGTAEDWPLFIASFEGTTRMCGFSDEENLYRLQKCLKNKALDAVKSKLLLPSCVPNIIATLKMMFGRPELIINSLLQQLRNTPPPRAEKLETVVQFALAVENLCSTMQASGLSTYLCNPSLLQELTDKLPAALKLNWALHKQSILVCTIAEFSSWIYKIAEAASSVTVLTPPAMEQKLEKRSQHRGFVNAHYLNASTSESALRQSVKTCTICQATYHPLEVCRTFQKLSLNERWTAIKTNRLCRKCLRNHGNYQCRSTSTCGTDGCTFKHHPLLHNNKPKVENPTTPCTEPQMHPAVSNAINCVHNTKEISSSIMFRIVPVVLYGNGTEVNTFAFLDDGSSITLIDEEIANRLNLVGKPQPLCLNWTSDTHRMEKQSKNVSLQISGSINQHRKFDLNNIHTVRQLQLPIQSLSVAALSEKYDYIKRLPIESYQQAVPRILIGLDHLKLSVPLKCKEGAADEPVATKTRLGWTVFGTCRHNTNHTNSHFIHHHSVCICECENHTDSGLHQLVKEYFSLDNLGVAKPDKMLVSFEEERANQILQSSTSRIGDRFVTGLLWKYDEIHLPNSLPMAKRRLACLEKRMSCDTDLKNNLKNQINDYVSKGYIRKLSADELSDNIHHKWYLPIFPVSNPNKPTKKVRIVWDAAAKVQGVSLNDFLLKGPDQLTSLPGVLHKFRERKVALCADIQQMFHQIRIRDEDQHVQRFLWRTDENAIEPDVYVMQVMTFGATCSPSSAQFVKNKNAAEFINEYPRAVQSITQNHYVDDFLDSVDNEMEAIQLANEVKFIHAKGGFNIRNWLSNSSLVLQNINDGEEICSNMLKNLDIDGETHAEKVLGMWWCPKTDTFAYKIKSNDRNSDILSGKRKPTKREVLRILMSIYDPLGLMANFLIFVKILLQEIWRAPIGWEDEISDSQFEKWLTWTSLLENAESMRIPRCYLRNCSYDNKVIELHTFVDASENAYCAASYLRIVNKAEVECCLVGAKTRVAPLKLLSIPRLELQAAMLGVRLANSLAESHAIQFERRYFWSDSRTVLCWLRSDHRKYRQFVAFRVSEILETTNLSEWNWVPTNQNVADEGTKWKTVPTFSESSRWLNGPDFLKLSQDEWPTELPNKNESTDEELKAHTMFHNCLQPTIIDYSRFSKWEKLLRTAAYLLRAVNNFKANLNRSSDAQGISGIIRQDEYIKAENYLYRHVQYYCYRNEIETLQKTIDDDIDEKPKIKKSSALYGLSPYIDVYGVLRVNGRIDATPGVADDLKRPIILPREHQVTQLILDFYHRRYHHQNHETVVNEVRQKYAISRLRALLTKIRRQCQWCTIANAVPRPPQMGNLPLARLSTFTRPFSFVGIDYFGPINICIRRSTEKRWGVLLTCMTTRAIHIEVAHSLSTSSCILALRNFVARRGTPTHLYSDNGTNFKGSERELREALQKVDQTQLANEFCSANTQWSFIPPSSPHMGGSWERMIQSVKKTLYQIMPTRNPSDELLLSMLLEVESVVNSRPLTYIPIDDEASEAITPNHFLLGNSSGNKPLTIFNDDTAILKASWRKSQQYADSFWKRWIREYLPTLTRRSKWFEPVKPIAVGDIVVIVDPDSPRNCWPKGKIIQVSCSTDGQVRSARVQTATGIYVRPAVKLAILNVSEKAGSNTARSSCLTRGAVDKNVDLAEGKQKPHNLQFNQHKTK